MSRIIAAVFPDGVAADCAVEELRWAGFDSGDLDRFAVNAEANGSAAANAERPAGIMIAVNVGFNEDEEVAHHVMRDAGARMVEWARGEWRNGQWSDFDPAAPPREVEYFDDAGRPVRAPSARAMAPT